MMTRRMTMKMMTMIVKRYSRCTFYNFTYYCKQSYSICGKFWINRGKFIFRIYSFYSIFFNRITQSANRTITTAMRTATMVQKTKRRSRQRECRQKKWKKKSVPILMTTIKRRQTQSQSLRWHFRCIVAMQQLLCLYTLFAERCICDSYRRSIKRRLWLDMAHRQSSIAAKVSAWWVETARKCYS